jgi:hypothetical protein
MFIMCNITQTIIIIQSAFSSQNQIRPCTIAIWVRKIPNAIHILPRSCLSIMKSSRKQLDDLLPKGLIWKSASKCGAPVFFTAKKDHTWLMCID